MTIHEQDAPTSLAAAILRLGEATTLEGVQHVVRTAARRLVEADGATLVLREGDLCFYADEDAVSPLWKGQRFPITDCISGWAMLHETSAVVPNIKVDERIPQEAYRPTFVESLVMVPIGRTRPLGAIGAYWATAGRASEADAAIIAGLAEATAPVLARFLPKGA